MAGYNFEHPAPDKHLTGGGHDWLFIHPITMSSYSRQHPVIRNQTLLLPNKNDL
jgi:hypothetical protein